jgi:hypothetical protein
MTPRGLHTSKWDILVYSRLSECMASNKHIRAIAAWVCLLAVALLYAPLAVAALVANGVDCCAGGYCKIPEHHHNRQKPGTEHFAVTRAQAGPSQDSSHTDCGHEMNGVGMAPCKMSCCEDPSRPALTPSAFLLPSLSFVPATFEKIRSVQTAKSFEPTRFVKPLSPPPRLVYSIL